MKKMVISVLVAFVVLLILLIRSEAKIYKLKHDRMSLEYQLEKCSDNLDLFQEYIDTIQKKVDSLSKLNTMYEEYQNYLEKIGNLESSNNYSAVNPEGYLGKYQFSMNTLKMLGIYTTKENFLNNPVLQEYAMYKYTEYNKKILKKQLGKSVYNKYSWKLLAGSHFAGVGNAISYYKTGYNPKDKYNTELKTYYKSF